MTGSDPILNRILGYPGDIAIASNIEYLERAYDDAQYEFTHCREFSRRSRVTARI